MTILVDEKSAWNPTWQVWIMVAKIVGNSIGTSLKEKDWTKFMASSTRQPTRTHQKVHILLKSMFNLEYDY